jgi:hypothetical protein
MSAFTKQPTASSRFGHKTALAQKRQLLYNTTGRSLLQALFLFIFYAISLLSFCCCYSEIHTLEKTKKEEHKLPFFNFAS